MDWKQEKPEEGSMGTIEALEQRTRMYMASATEQHFVEYLQKMLGRIQNQKYQVKLLNEELDRSYQMYLNRVEAAGREIQPEALKAESLSEPSQPIAQPSQNFEYQPQPTAPAVPVKKSSTEFVIGTVLLSIVGGAFILAALVMLGMYFMNGFIKGMILYAGTGVLLLVSELVLYRRWPKLGRTFSAISIGGFYLSTVLNYLTFGNFNMWIALLITLVITVMVVLLSWKRDSMLYRALGLITCYLSFLAIQGDCTLQEIVVLAMIVLLINIMCIVVPVDRYKTGFRILHIYVNGIYTFLVCSQLNGLDNMENAQLVWALSAMFIMQLLFVLQIRYQNREAISGRNVGKYGIVAAYFVSGLFYYFSLPASIRDESLLLNYGSFAVMLVLSLVAMLLLRKSREVWYPYYMINLIAFDVFCIWGEDWEIVIAMAVMVIIAKLLSLLQVSELRISEVIITTISCILCLGYAGPELGLYAVVLVSVLLFSILFIRYWQTYYEILLTFTLAFFAAIKLPSVLQLSAFVGIMFVGILLFNNVQRWQGKNIGAFNGLALAAQIICFLLLFNPIYRNAYIVYLCMLIFGLATIVLTFQEKYHMNFTHKNLVLAVFLTYMAFVVRTNLPIINSILMMLIALICVALGFGVKEKAVRIYGLVLSLIICGKITLYDFFDAETLQKTVLFFVVGIIVLAISGIYIILERRMNIQQNNNGEEQ